MEYFHRGGGQLFIDSDVLVRRVYTTFITLTGRHTYLTTKNVINMQINVKIIFLKESY